MYCAVEVSSKDTLPGVFRNFVDCVCSPNASGDPLLQHLKEASCNTAQRPQDCPSGTRHLDLGRATSSVLSLSSWSMLPFFEVCAVEVYGKDALPGVFRNFMDCICSPDVSGVPLLRRVKEPSCTA
ncbi:hypothetical protein ACQJBY_062559 [Aegilops geniculata]